MIGTNVCQPPCRPAATCFTFSGRTPTECQLSMSCPLSSSKNKSGGSCSAPASSSSSSAPSSPSHSIPVFCPACGLPTLLLAGPCFGLVARFLDFSTGLEPISSVGFFGLDFEVLELFFLDLPVRVRPGCSERATTVWTWQRTIERAALPTMGLERQSGFEHNRPYGDNRTQPLTTNTARAKLAN